eukprot:258159-Chlamydomonas_euryale.AAC.1
MSHCTRKEACGGSLGLGPLKGLSGCLGRLVQCRQPCHGSRISWNALLAKLSLTPLPTPKKGQAKVSFLKG